MRRFRAALIAGLGLAAACHELPSAVPLSNTGGVLDDPGTDRDRRPQASAHHVAAESESRPAPPPPPRSAASTPVEVPLDAGAPTLTAAADAGVAAVAWAGDYFGSDRLVRHFEGEADDVELDDKAHTRVEQTGPTALVISIINSASDDVICALHATAQGATATLDPGQSCFGDDGSTATVTDGRVSLGGDRLLLDFAGKVVENDDDDEGDSLEFRLEYHFDGRRR
jgi:hypothetical protein